MSAPHCPFLCGSSISGNIICIQWRTQDTPGGVDNCDGVIGEWRVMVLPLVTKPFLMIWIGGIHLFVNHHILLQINNNPQYSNYMHVFLNRRDNFVQWRPRSATMMPCASTATWLERDHANYASVLESLGNLLQSRWTMDKCLCGTEWLLWPCQTCSGETDSGKVQGSGQQQRTLVKQEVCCCGPHPLLLGTHP